MGFAIRILMLVGFIKLLLAVDSPLLCAGIYAAIGLVFRLAFGTPLWPALLLTALAFGLAWLYFWLLYRLRGSGWFWVVAVGGAVAGLV